MGRIFGFSDFVLEILEFCSSNGIRRFCVRSEHPGLALERRGKIYG